MSKLMTRSRREWLPCLIACERESVIALAEKIEGRYTVHDLSLPASGLGVLTMQDGAFQESYFLGEFPLAHAHIELVLGDGQSSRGAAHVMHDDSGYARSLAILDATLATDATGMEEVHDIEKLIAAGKQQRTNRERERKTILARTRVDFAELSTTDGDDGDDN